MSFVVLLKTERTSARCHYYFFFFQAEDGIRDYKVTGVQTCALPISHDLLLREEHARLVAQLRIERERDHAGDGVRLLRKQRRLHVREGGLDGVHVRSEERRVGKECRSRWSPYH